VAAAKKIDYEYDSAELAAFEQALRKMMDARRHRRPTHPRKVLREIMTAQGLSEEGVAEKTGLDRSDITALLSGERRFTSRTMDRFKGWLGATAETLHTLQHMYDAFQKAGQRSEQPASKPEPRTVRYFASLKR
jgi:plasmid maintenance system antidote protein VapI